MTKITQVKFYGIDAYNRPIFKAVGARKFYGSTERLFSMYATEAEVLERIEPSDLSYFGSKFNCEPMGTEPSCPLQIV